MITLHQFPSCFGIPNASPFGMKVETYLRLAKLAYEVEEIVGDLRSTPRGQAPYIVDKGKTVDDSALVFEYLKKIYGDPLGKGMSAEQKAVDFALTHLLEDHLYFIMLSERWTVPENMKILKDSFFAPVPAVMRGIIFNMAQKGQVRRLKGQGMAKFNRQEIQDMGRRVIDNLSDILGENRYFGKDRPREIDCVTFSFIANGLLEEFETPLAGYFKGKENLATYSDRMMEEVFPEFVPVSE